MWPCLWRGRGGFPVLWRCEIERRIFHRPLFCRTGFARPCRGLLWREGDLFLVGGMRDGGSLNSDFLARSGLSLFIFRSSRSSRRSIRRDRLVLLWPGLSPFNELLQCL